MIPSSIRPHLIQARNLIFGFLHRGSQRQCPICEKGSSKFLAAGTPPRPEAQCPQCASRERHRLVWLFFQRKTDLFDGKTKKFLHVAPESCLEPRLKRILKEGYLTADLMNPRVMIKMDITDIQYPDESFDVIYCSHVLEHVPDDRRAMREFFRVLRPTGWAVVLVPVTSDITYEDPSITTPEGRLAAFGQEDHVRRYGPDYIDRLRESGFVVEKFDATDLADEQDIVRMGLTADSGSIYFCRRPSSDTFPAT
jgi:SAM-dependent methyltransferase